jgi:type IV secretory pathway VirB10-like protein
MIPPNISGGGSSLKPWHIILMILVCLLAIGSIPFVSYLVTKQKHEDVTAAVQAGVADSGGEPWHPADDTPKKSPDIQLVAARPANTQAGPANPLVSQQPLSSVLPGGKSTAPTNQRMFGQPQTPPPPPPPSSSAGASTDAGQLTRASAAPAADSMTAMLKPTETSGYIASRIAKPWATIEQGRIIACNSVTRMTSQMAGFVKAKVTYDVKSVDGTTTLIDRNSTLFGEIAHGLAAGQDRLFVLWRSVMTPAPDFVQITLNAPAADELGEAGLQADVNHHTWQRIGGALMLSGVNVGLQGLILGLTAALEHGNNGGGGGGGSNLNFYQFQGQGQSLSSDLLSHTVNIPDTGERDQALPCTVFTTGAMDFSSVYELRRRGQ